MAPNLHSVEKLTRLLVGLVLVIVGYLFSLPFYFSYLLYIVGVYLVLSGLLGWCVFYSMFGHSNRKRVSRITRQDIEDAVKQYPVNNETSTLDSVRVNASRPEKPASTKKSSPSKKKAPAKKTAPKKAATKKSTTTKKTSTKSSSTTKKPSSKKPAVKKSSASTKKSSPSKKKAPAKKTAPKKAATKKSTTTKKTSNKKPSTKKKSNTKKK